MLLVLSPEDVGSSQEDGLLDDSLDDSTGATVHISGICQNPYNITYPFLMFPISFLQISEICTVAPVLSSSESSNNPSSGEDPTSAGDNTSNKNSDSNSNNGDLNLKDLNSVTIQSSQSVNELICLDESTSSISQTDFGGITLDNFTLDDLNDDEFNPRAVDSQLKQQQLPSTLVQVLTANEPTTTPTGLLVPPPALPPREFKKISPVPENNNNPFR